MSTNIEKWNAFYEKHKDSKLTKRELSELYRKENNLQKRESNYIPRKLVFSTKYHCRKRSLENCDVVCYKKDKKEDLYDPVKREFSKHQKCIRYPYYTPLIQDFNEIEEEKYETNKESKSQYKNIKHIVPPSKYIDADTL